MVGICSGVNPDVIFHLSRWCSAKTFYKHSMIQEILQAFTNIIFNINDPLLNLNELML